MAARDLTAEDIADWLTPSQAIDILYGVFKDYSLCTKTLLGRLRGGMVQAVSGHTLIEGSRPTSRTLLYKIPSDHWQHVDSHGEFWTTGDLNYEFRDYGTPGESTAQHYDVRFEPQEVRAIIGSGAKGIATAPAEPEPESKGPPVSDEHLRAWFEVYKRAYTGSVHRGDGDQICNRDVSG
jgi:hypothetical protein